MRYNQPMQYNPQENTAPAPLNIEPHSSSPINQIGTPSQRCNKWVTIISYIVLAVTGQSIARLLENYFYLHINNKHSQDQGIWTQSILQVIGFPILLFPFLILCSKKQNQYQVKSNSPSLEYLAGRYFLLGYIMMIHALNYTISKSSTPFNVFTLIYITQLLFTVLLTAMFKKIINLWIVNSLVLAILAGAALTFSSSFANDNHVSSITWLALLAALSFSCILWEMENIFDDVIPDRNESTNEKAGLAVVLNLLIFSFLFATVVFAAFILTSGEHHNIRREMDGFSKGKIAYMRTMVAQAAAWQVYWVGVAGLVFTVSAVFSNVIIVCTWPIVSLLVIFFDGQYDVFKGTALAMAAISVALHLCVHREKKSHGDCDEAKS